MHMSLSNRKNLGIALFASGVSIFVFALYIKSFLVLLIGLIITTPSLGLFYKKATSGCVFVCSVFLAFFAAEYLLGLLDPKQNKLVNSGSFVEDFFVESDIGVQAKSGTHSAISKTIEGETIYSVKYTIGNDGFRITQTDINNPERINFFGCSVTFGAGLEDNETFPYYVAQLGKYKVKNFGISGYGPHQALAILTSKRDTTGKLNFFLTAPWHAERSACIPSYSVGSPHYTLENGKLIRDGVCGGNTGFVSKILAKSKIYNLVSKSFSNQDYQIDLYLALIKEMNRLSNDQGQQFLVGFFKADRDWFTGSYSNELILERLKSNGIQIIDLTLAETNEKVKREYHIHELDKHPSAQANEERAKLTVKVLSNLL